LYSTQNIIRTIKLIGMKWAYMEEKRRAYMFWWESQKDRDY
jgi:hypothetical protein